MFFILVIIYVYIDWLFCFDDLVLNYGVFVAGTVVGMTGPVIYKRYEHWIKEYCWRAREQW